MEKTKVFRNDTKVIQLYYDRFRNPHEVSPGGTYVENLDEVIDVNALVKKEIDRRKMETDVTEMKRIRRTLGLVRMAKKVEDLEKMKENEMNPDVLDAILVREKELLDAAN